MQEIGADMTEDRAGQWERVSRVQVYNSPRRARYPSVAAQTDGSLLVLFTRQTGEQEAHETGDLLLVRSDDQGRTWSEPETVFEGRDGEPRANGTLTVLRDGRVLAPFAVLGPEQTTSAVRLLTLDGAGRDGQVSGVQADCPLAWWAPCARVVETADGTLVMPVYGAATDARLRATLHGCGLLRSRDRGKSWADYTWLAEGPGPVMGAAPNRVFSFEGPSVLSLPDGRWLAVVTGRRLNRSGDGPSATNEGPGSPQILCRLWSRDQGRTWTPPEQLTSGAWPALAAVGPETFCVNTLWAAWGEIRVEVSADGFETIAQELPTMHRGWVHERCNRPDETPLPPTVPYLGDAWSFEHYGFPAALPVDGGLMVVFGRTQRGTPGYLEFDPPEDADIPMEQERIQAVFYQRAGTAGHPALPLGQRPDAPTGRWILVERRLVPDVGGLARAPNGELIGRLGDRICRSRDGAQTWEEIPGAALPCRGGAFAILSSGRWISAATRYNGPGDEPQDVSEIQVMGESGGYAILKHRCAGEYFDHSVVVSYSDDEGRTWHAGEPFKGPFQWAMPTACRFVEAPDGTIAVPIFGCVTDDEVASYSASNGVIRSRDGGHTWEDFSFIFRTQPPGPDEFQSEPRYSEMDVVQLPNGHWIAFSRHERVGAGPQFGATSVALSTDFGRTWHPTGGRLQGVSQQTGLVLPDGGVALTYRTHSWQAPGVAITYDEGRTFSYLLTGPYETVNALVTGDDEFVVFSATSQRSDRMAGVYRWVPAARG